MHIKQQLYTEVKNIINNRHQQITSLINSIQESLQSETKSSAGDKHETGRAMLQLEREKAGNQFAEIERLRQILMRINVKASSKNVHLGSLVTTNNGVYFIAIGIGELILNSKSYYVIGLNAPIGKLLFGKQKGDEFRLNNKNYQILKVN